VIRKCRGWDISSIIQEYCSYADTKVRDNDIRYIHAFDTATLAGLLDTPGLDIAIRSADFTDNTGGTRFVKIGKFAVLTAAVLGLWALTAFRIRV
jgi:hypothetical protein